MGAERDACLGPDPAPDALLDLMLAKDEVWRRQDVLSTSDRLVSAQIAAGELDTAVAQLDFSHFVGDEWLVIGALLESGQDDRARLLFDGENPWTWFEDGHAYDTGEAMENWANFAVVLLDDGQIDRRIRIPTGRRGDDKDAFSGRTRDQHLARLTVREIRGHLEELYGIEVSPDLISTITDAVLETVAEWQGRPLDTCYPLVFFDAIRVKIRDEGFVRNKAVYIALGIQPDGTKEVLGIWIEQTEGAKFWLRVDERTQESRHRRYPDCRRRWPEGLPGGDQRRLPPRLSSRPASCT